jgi:hypothetical protein
MSRFIPVDRQTDYLLPPSVDEWLPDGHLARFVVAVVEPLDLSALTWRYAGRGHNAHHPAALLSLLVYVMPVTGKGFDQCYNAQAAVDTDTLLTAWQGYPEALGQPTCRLADTGDFSAANVQACHAHGIEPLLALRKWPMAPRC